MPEVKPISGHNGCRNIQRYVEGKSGERVVAQDFLNIAKENGPDKIAWYKQMDETRAIAGNDIPSLYRGVMRRPICYTHYVINPDPRDNVDIETLRDVTMTWVEENFSDFEVAVTYHDDSATGTLHAHVVINNTNLETGLRWSTYFKKGDIYRLNNDLQSLALERGLSGFTSDHISMNEREMSAAEKNVSTLGGVTSRWKDHRRDGHDSSRKAHKTLPRPSSNRRERRRDNHRDARVDRGEWSWVEEVADAVDVARHISRDEREFFMTLESMGIGVSLNSKGTDWIYSHPSAESRRVSGRRLGSSYTRSTIRMGFALGYVGWVQRMTMPERARRMPNLTKEQTQAVLSSITLVAAGQSLVGVSAKQMAELLDYNEAHGISSLADYGQGPKARAMRRMADKVGLFDEAVLTRARKRLENEKRTIGEWIIEERAARGEGGTSWAPPTRDSDGVTRDGSARHEDERGTQDIGR